MAAQAAWEDLLMVTVVAVAKVVPVAHQTVVLEEMAVTQIQLPTVVYLKVVMEDKAGMEMKQARVDQLTVVLTDRLGLTA